MKKRPIIIIFSVFIVIVLAATTYEIWYGRKDTERKDVWVEKTINKEIMKTDADCGIVSVKMLLDFYDINVSYAELEKNLKTTSEGTKWKDIKNYLNTIDKVEIIEFKENINKAKEYLENGYPLFICWDVDQNPEWSHYSILIAIDNKTVWMLDPEEKKSLSEYSLDYFLPCWNKENYWFCILDVPDKKNEMHEQSADGKTSEKNSKLKLPIAKDSLIESLSKLDANKMGGK